MLGDAPTETAVSAAVYTSARSIPHAGNAEVCGRRRDRRRRQVPPKPVLALEWDPRLANDVIVQLRQIGRLSLRIAEKAQHA